MNTMLTSPLRFEWCPSRCRPTTASPRVNVQTSEPEAAPEEPKTAPAEVAVEAAPSAEPTATA